MMERKLANSGSFLTRIEVREILYTWTIENFSLCETTNGKMMSSQKFPKLDEDQCEWNLLLYPGGDRKEAENFLSLFLQFTPAGKDTITVNYRFLVKSKNGKILKITTLLINDFKNNVRTYGFPKFLEQKTVLPLLKDDVLIIKCWVKWKTGVSEVNEEPLSVIEPDIRDQLSRDLGRFVNESSFSDAILEANDGTKFAAHKCILAARSPVFAAMFSSAVKEIQKPSINVEVMEVNTHKFSPGFKEAQESFVKIEDMGADILKSMLEFMYTNKLENQLNVEELLYVSDKYALEGLKLLSEQILIKNLKTDNVGLYLLLADRHNAEDLKKQSLKVISRNYKDVLETNALKDLASTNPTLFYDTIRAITFEM